MAVNKLIVAHDGTRYITIGKKRYKIVGDHMDNDQILLNLERIVKLLERRIKKRKETKQMKKKESNITSTGVIPRGRRGTSTRTARERITEKVSDANLDKLKESQLRRKTKK